MDNQKLHTILQLGESIAVEFKRCGNGIENDVYESVWGRYFSWSFG